MAPFDTLSRDATYIITPDSDVSYICVASAWNVKHRTVRARGTIMITVRGTYIYCGVYNIAFNVLCRPQYERIALGQIFLI